MLTGLVSIDSNINRVLTGEISREGKAVSRGPSDVSEGLLRTVPIA